MKSIFDIREGWETDKGIEQKRKTDSIDQTSEATKFSKQQIRMAYGVANDKRYKGGNMTGAVRAIEKIAKGLSKHPDVQKVLKVTNEDTQIDEAKNPFELYQSVKGWERASAAMVKELEKAKKMPNKQKARDHMYKVQKKYSKFGAQDTEANTEIRHALGMNEEVQQEALKTDTKIRMAHDKKKRQLQKMGKSPKDIEKSLKMNFPSMYEEVQQEAFTGGNDPKMVTDAIKRADDALKRAKGDLNIAKGKYGSMSTKRKSNAAIKNINDAQKALK